MLLVVPCPPGLEVLHLLLLTNLDLLRRYEDVGVYAEILEGEDWEMGFGMRSKPRITFVHTHKYILGVGN